jgi:hypothetical protein
MNRELMDAAWAKFDEAVEKDESRIAKGDNLTDAQVRMYDKLIGKKLDEAVELEAQALAA